MPLDIVVFINLCIPAPIVLLFLYGWNRKLYFMQDSSFPDEIVEKAGSRATGPKREDRFKKSI